jgi:hypothetical protein
LPKLNRNWHKREHMFRYTPIIHLACTKLLLLLMAPTMMRMSTQIARTR